MEATMERRSNLVMPTIGYELDREEMSYVEGGLSVSWTATWIDAGILLLSGGFSIIASSKWITKFVSKNALKLISVLGIGSSIFGLVMRQAFEGIGNAASWMSIGGFVANILDMADGNRNGDVNFG